MWHPSSRFAVESRCVSGGPQLSVFQDGHLAKVKIADTTIKKYHSRTWWPQSEPIPPVIFVILLRAGVTVEVMCRGLVGLSLASGLWFQAVVKVEVKTDDRHRVHELGRIIRRTTNLSSTFITG